MIKTILIIDDDIVSQFALRYTIQQCNIECNVLFCDGAQEALDLLTEMFDTGKNLPDIIFLDLDMPDIDGWGFLDKYFQSHADTTSIKIFIVSAFTSSLVRERAKHNGIVEGLYDKPLSRNNIIEILNPRV